ncbi:hypothetical protein HZB00_02580 [Candidatus Woesearchaeota archaeon]|nr:hypothetical protein [Candidatus Woesearchaeota archaeon]
MKAEQHSEYYEAILQIRPAKKEFLLFIEEELGRRTDVKIAKEVPLKTGIDLYLSSRQFAWALGQKLKKRFRGTLTVSRTLHTIHRMTSKELYRSTILFRADYS